MLVLDASAALPLLLNSERGARVRERLGAGDETAHVPHVFDLELIQALRAAAGRHEIGADRASRAIEALRRLRVVRYPHVPMARQIWRLRDNLSAYDAAYVALAEILDAPLITRDARLARSPGHSARIELFE